MSRADKLQRVEHANQLIAVIAAHGRRFFCNEKDGRISRFELDNRGRVWFIDDYRGARVYTHQTTFGNRFRGFTHGGTLRSLIENMRDYITKGEKLPRWVIAPQRSFDKSDIWGYGETAAPLVRAAAYALPIMAEDDQA